ncbi:MAG TPA: hypothetical protein VD886_05435 [Herpetosiphonaceae bacterium]|nr:hypothetical protein [Herpetosiphonaceae bacterium]
MTHRVSGTAFSRIRHLSAWFSRASSWPAALAATVVFAVFLTVVLPQQSRATRAVTGGARSPDTALFYTPAELYEIAEIYGPAGRAAYVRARWTFDVVWPLAYTAFLTTMLSIVVGRVAAAGSPWRLANLAPLVGMLCDYLENSATSLVLGRFPQRTPGVDMLAPLFTALKWLFVNGSFVLLAGGAVIAGWRWGAARSRLGA